MGAERGQAVVNERTAGNGCLRCAATEPPREGLPPCLRLAAFEGWQAAYVDRRKDCHDWPPFNQRGRFEVSLIKISDLMRPWGPHPEITSYAAEVIAMRCDTDDPEEAERLWEEAREKLREVGRE